MARAGFTFRVVKDGQVVTGATIEIRRKTQGMPLPQVYAEREGGSPLGNPFIWNDTTPITVYVDFGGAFQIKVTKVIEGETWQEIWPHVAISTGAETDFGTMFTPAGEWESDVSYDIGQIVSVLNGEKVWSFASRIDDNLNHEPLFADDLPDLTDAYWQAVGLVESPGAPGSALMVGNSDTEIDLDTVALGDDVLITLTDVEARGYGKGAIVRAASKADPVTKWIEGAVTAYSHPDLTIKVSAFAGTGAFTDVQTVLGGRRGASGVSAGLPFTFDDTETTTPGTGTVSVSAEDFSTLTDMSPGYIYFSDTDADGDDVEAFLLTVGDSTSASKGFVTLKRPDGNGKSIFKIVGASDHSGTRTRVPVSFVSGSTGFVGGVDLAAEFDLRGDAGSGAAAFTDLDDAPASYSGHANKLVVVKNDESGVEFKSMSSTSVFANATGSAAAGGAVQATTNDTFLARVSGALDWVQLTYAMIASAALATAANMMGNAASKLLSVRAAYDAQVPVALTDAATIAIDFLTFTNATCTISGNRAFGNPSNEASVIGKSGWIAITASGSTRTIDRHADMKSIGITWPISIGSGQTAYIYYEVVAANNIQILAVRNNPS